MRGTSSRLKRFSLFSYLDSFFSVRMKLIGEFDDLYQKKDDFEALVIEHLRMNGAYWGLTTLDLLNKIGAIDVDAVVSWVMECQDKDCGKFVTHNKRSFFCGRCVMHLKSVISGGFAGNLGHDPHLLYTISAVQILALLDRLDVLDIEKVSDCILLVWSL